MIFKQYGIIYRIKNLVNGKIYIGKTTRAMTDRWYEHVSKKKHKCYIDRAIQKHGRDNFVIEEIDSAESEQMLNDLERYWIQFYRSSNREIGYNLGGGGEAGTLSQERRIERAKFFVQCVDTGECFVSTFEAACHTGISLGGINQVIKGQNLLAGGLRWKKVNKIDFDSGCLTWAQSNRSSKGRGTGNRRRVLCVETNSEYPTVTEAAKTFGMRGNHLSYAIRFQNGKAKGFTFKYLDEIEDRFQKFPHLFSVERRKRSERYSKPIMCIDTGKIWPSLKSAREELQGSEAHLSTCAKSGRPYRGQYYRFLEKDVVAKV